MKFFNPLLGFVSFLSRFLMATLPKFFNQHDLVLSYRIGWDGIHPWALYSWSGIPRRDFMRFYKMRQAGQMPDTDDICYAPYKIPKEERGNLKIADLQKVVRRTIRMRRWFARTMNWGDVFNPRL